MWICLFVIYHPDALSVNALVLENIQVQLPRSLVLLALNQTAFTADSTHLHLAVVTHAFISRCVEEKSVEGRRSKLGLKTRIVRT